MFFLGECVSKSFICDGDDDCSDGSDENNDIQDCLSKTCGPDRFTCQNKKRCVPLSHVCDGENDCGDASDESPSEGCTFQNCNPLQFRLESLISL